MGGPDYAPYPSLSLLPSKAVKTPASVCCPITPPGSRLCSKPPTGIRGCTSTQSSLSWGRTSHGQNPAMPGKESGRKPRLWSQMLPGPSPSLATWELSRHLSEPQFPHL